MSTGCKLCVCCNSKQPTRLFQTVRHTEIGYAYNRICKTCCAKFKMSFHEQIHLPCQECNERKFGKDMIYVNLKKTKFLCKTCCPPKLKNRKPGDKMINSPDTLSYKTDFNSQHQERFSKVLEIMGFNEAQRGKAINSNFYEEIRGNAKSLWDKRSEMIKHYQRLNKQYFQDYNKSYKKKFVKIMISS